MSSIVVSGDVSGSITLAAPAVAGSNTLTLPVASDTLVGLAATQTLTNKTLTSPTISSPTISGTPVMSASVITSGTANSSISGSTSVDFTGIPSWVKRVTVMFNGISTGGTSNYLVQIGSGSVVNTGYTSYANVNTNLIGSTAGFILTYNNTAAGLHTGYVVLTLLTGNTWVCNGQNGRSNDNAMSTNTGVVALSGALDRVRLTSVLPDTFDAGTINIFYE